MDESNTSSKPAEIARFLKDIWHPNLLMFGTINFPTENLDPDQLYFHFDGAKGDSGTFAVSIVEGASDCKVD